MTFACVCCAMCCGSYLTAVDDLGFGCLHVVPSVLLYLVSLALVCVFGFGADFAFTCWYCCCRLGFAFAVWLFV